MLCGCSIRDAWIAGRIVKEDKGVIILEVHQ
jgi:hypothetical protein